MLWLNYDAPGDQSRRHYAMYFHPAFWLLIAAAVMIAVCWVMVSSVYDTLFVRSVLHEQLGWRYEARIEGFNGREVVFSDLTFKGQPVGERLPQLANLVTPIGEFVRSHSGWYSAAFVDEMWDHGPIVSVVRDNEPWVAQVPLHPLTAEQLQTGWCQAPPETDSFADPWTRQQFEGTPSEWVYVYRQHHEKSSLQNTVRYSTEGYWVAPHRLNELPWHVP